MKHSVWKRLMGSSVFLSCLIFCATLSADLVVFDEEMETANWEQQIELYGGSGSGGGAANHEDAGGNPGAYREVHLDRIPSGVDPENVSHLYSWAKQTAYNPSTTGPITVLDIQFDARMIDGDVGMVAPAVKQGGVVYVGEAQSVDEGNWTIKLFLNLDEDSFSAVEAPNSHPDFSASGGAVLFGFAFIISAPGAAKVEGTAGFDNWGVYAVTQGELAFLINAGLNDAWYNAGTPGQGFFFTVLPDFGVMFIAWFTFDTQRPPGNVAADLGEPGHRWVTAIGEYEGDTVVLDVELTSGGVFDSANPAVEQEANYGTITIVFHGCNSATLTYDFPSLGLMGEIELTRIVPDNVPLCETLWADLRGQ